MSFGLVCGPWTRKNCNLSILSSHVTVFIPEGMPIETELKLRTMSANYNIDLKNAREKFLKTIFLRNGR